EMDASVMVGDTLAAGAVGAVAGVPNPIRLARAVMEEGREVLLVGATVGAVARDGRGHVAAATSTGGLAGKRAGRVGDSAILGAGTYADDRLGAGSATGPGELIMRGVLVRDALARVAQGADPARAAEDALAALAARL